MILSLAVLLAAQPLAGHSLVYSAREKAVLLIGGDAVGARPIYKLRGSSWVALPNSDLPVRSLPAVAADSSGNILMHGGSIGSQKSGGGMDFKVTADTWLWNGTVWNKVATSGPKARDHHSMVYDSARKKFVLFGGSDADPSGRSEFFSDTWEWDGKAWAQVATQGPGLRCHFAMAYDPIRKNTILIGGYGPQGGDQKTWSWDGKSWRVAAEGTPGGRTSPRLAWDQEGKRVLLFGGEAGNNSPSDMWAWTGSNWKSISAVGPPGRTVHGFAWDETMNAAVTYGGASGNDVLDDIWLFRGGKWRKLS